jgi:hypothetical protein
VAPILGPMRHSLNSASLGAENSSTFPHDVLGTLSLQPAGEPRMTRGLSTAILCEESFVAFKQWSIELLHASASCGSEGPHDALAMSHG